MEYKLNSQLNIHEITNEFQIIKKIICNNQSIILNFSDVKQIDTATIALIIELNKFATNNKKNLKYINMPLQIEKLCNLYQIKY